MIISSVAKRYARALFELAREKKLVDQLLAELKLFYALVEKNENLRLVLKQPASLSREKLLASLLTAKYSTLFQQFLSLLLNNNRFELFSQIVAAYEEKHDQFKQVMPAQVVTAVPLSAKIAERLKQELKALYHSDIRLDNKIDPSMIGGLIIRIQGQVFDASIVHKLQQLKYYLTKNVSDYGS